MSQPLPTDYDLVERFIAKCVTVIRALLLPLWLAALAVWLLVVVAAAVALGVFATTRYLVDVCRGASLGSGRSAVPVPHQEPSRRRP
jgi:hypothetical protein